MKPLHGTALAALVLIAGGGGFVYYRHVLLGHTGSLTPAPAAAATVLNATADAAASEPQPDTQDEIEAAQAPTRPVPSTLPDLKLPDLAGRPQSLRSFVGRPLIVNFWATWCAPCRREIPLLQRLRREHHADRLEVVGIAVDSRSAVADYVKKLPIDYPLLVGEQQGLEAIQQFGMQAVLPFSAFVAASGQIVALKIGELHPNEAAFILAALDRVDNGSQSLSAARADIAAALQRFALERARKGTVAG